VEYSGLVLLLWPGERSKRSTSKSSDRKENIVVAKKILVATGTTTTYILFVVSTAAVILICFLDLVVLFTSAVLVQTEQHQEGLPCWLTN
jgi:hypothetical protein